MFDNLRTEDPPVTYAQIEENLTGHWLMTTPWEQAGDFFSARELIFQPNSVWVTPSFKDYGGKYYLEGMDQIRLHHDPTNTDKTWSFHLVGDTLWLTDGVTTVQYARQPKPGSTPQG